MLFPSAPSSLGTTPAFILLRTASFVLAAATAPLALELLTLTAGSLLPERGRRRKRIHPVAPVTPLGLMVIVPAHNEQLLLSRCVQSLLADLPLGSSVLVVAHNCTDNTAQVAVDSGAEVLMLNDDGGQGKSAALRAGFRHAIARGARVLAVVDADSLVAPGFSAAIAEVLMDGAEAFQARYIVLGGEDEATSRLTALGFLGFNVIRPRGRAWLGMSAGIFGNGFGFRSSVLERVPYEANSLVEDLEYHLRLVDAGIRVEFLKNATVSSEMPQNSAAASSQRARWEGGRLRVARIWLPRLLRRALAGRLSLLEPALDLASLPLASEVVLLATCLLLPVPWLRIYALAAFGVVLAYVAVAAAEGNGWWSALRTLLSVPRYILWKLRILPRTLASSRPDAAWIRTEREAAPATVTPIDSKQRPVTPVPVRDPIVAGSGKGRR
ncbi:MAG TPA: glycosyltransferase family 2 protein [Acidobacteriaceae bacterium]|jgi:cellulose synthase/poly-beta-1,6-N-acetylglucosamine synthase-like glycosyltransferase